MSEATNSLVLAVSEETGQISLAQNGKLSNNLTPLEIRQLVNNYLFGEGTETQKRTADEESVQTETKPGDVAEASASA